MIFPIQRYVFNLVATSDIYLPAYSGSVLRGNFGNVLRKTVCFTKQDKCDNCPLIERCSYSRLYNTISQYNGKKLKSRHPYVIEPLEYNRRFIAEGEKFSFNMVLFGNSAQDLSLYIFIWEKVFTTLGFVSCQKKGYANLLNVMSNGKLIFDNTIDNSNLDALNHILEIDSSPTQNISEVFIKLITPLRLQGRDSDGKSIIIGTNSFNEKAFIGSILRRSQEFLSAHNLEYNCLNYNDNLDIKLVNKHLSWVKTKRYSGAQRQEMEFYGVIGNFTLTGTDLANFLPWLELCSYLHLGKSSTFGFGQFYIEKKHHANNQ